MTNCPICGTPLNNGDVVNSDQHGEVIEQVIICNDCNSQVVLGWGDPIIEDVMDSKGKKYVEWEVDEWIPEEEAHQRWGEKREEERRKD